MGLRRKRRRKRQRDREEILALRLKREEKFRCVVGRVCPGKGKEWGKVCPLSEGFSLGVFGEDLNRTFLRGSWSPLLVGARAWGH